MLINFITYNLKNLFLIRNILYEIELCIYIVTAFFSYRKTVSNCIIKIIAIKKIVLSAIHIA